MVMNKHLYIHVTDHNHYDVGFLRQGIVFSTLNRKLMNKINVMYISVQMLVQHLTSCTCAVSLTNFGGKI